MHVSPDAFRAVRRDGVTLHFAVLGDVAYALAELPSTGSAGTFLESPCEDPHWGFVVRGALEIEIDGARRDVPQGTAFHVPPGLGHRLFIAGSARVAGFAPLKPDAPTTDSELRTAGFEVVRPRRDNAAGLALVQPRPERPPAAGEIVTEARRMGDLVYMRTRFGARSGYTGQPCDVAHWGLVIAGSIAIESEDAVEVVTAGDVYRCEAGPPGHRLQAADPATIVDFTPADALRTAERVTAWRRAAAEEALRDEGPPPSLELTALL